MPREPRAAPQRLPITWRECVIHGFILLVLVTCLFPRIIFGHEVALPGTLLFEWPPWNHHAPAEGFRPAVNDSVIEAFSQFRLWHMLSRDAIASGEWPLWNPYEFTGMPLLANFQSAVFYPFNILNMVLDLSVAITIYTLLKVWLCGAGAYLCARVMGLGIPASRFASVAWMFCAYNILWLYWHNGWVSAWAPVVLLGAECILQRQYRKGFAVIMAAGTLLILAGHPETSFAYGEGVGLYFLCRLALMRPKTKDAAKMVAAALGAWLVALGICAAQLAPFIEYVGHSMSYGVLVEESHDSLSPQALVSFWVPRFHGFTADGNYWGVKNSNHVSLSYVGIATLVAASLLLSPGPLRTRRKALCLAAPALLLALLAFDVPGMSWLKHLPVLSDMWGLWHIISVCLFLAFLGAMGLEHWTRGGASPKGLIAPVVLSVCATGAVFALYRFNSGVLRMQGLDGYTLRQVVLSGGLAAGAILLAFLAWKAPRIGIALMTLLLAAELLHLGRNVNPTCPRDQVLVDTGLTRYLLEQKPPIRVSVEASPVRPAVLANYGIEELWGYDGIFPGRILSFFGLAARGAWPTLEPLCATTHFLFAEGTGPQSEDPSKGLEKVATLDGLDVFRNNRAFSRAFLVGKLRVLPDEGALIDAMCAEDYDPASEAVTDAPPKAALPESGLDNLGAVKVLKRMPLHVSVDVKAKAACVLVLADAFYPGWQARVNAEPAEVFPVYHNFRGVLVPDGESRVEFDYDPVSFQIGFWVSVAVMLTMSGLGAVLLLRGRRAA